jgi:hypothetical protein
MKRALPVVLAAVALLAPATSFGAVTIGSTLFATATLTNFGSCSGGTACTYAQVAPLPSADTASGGLTSPIDGVITRWVIRTGSTGGVVKLRVLRPSGAGAFTAVATGPAQTMNFTGQNMFPVSLPIKKGDYLGVDNASDALIFAQTQQASSYYWNPQLADGTNRTTNGTQAPLELLVQANVEPDADCDGRGDETQDPDISDGPCAHPGGDNGVGPGAGPDVVAPTIGALSFSPHKPRAGTRVTFGYSVSEASRAVLTIERRLSGRRGAGDRCVKQTQKNRKHAHCTRFVLAGTVARNTAAGHGSSRFRVATSGSYRATLVGTDAAGNVSLPRSVRFEVRPRKR